MTELADVGKKGLTVEGNEEHEVRNVNFLKPSCSSYYYR